MISFDWIRQLPWLALLKIGQTIVSKRRWVIPMAILCAAAAFLGWKYLRRVQQYEEVIQRTLKQEMMATPQTHKGLEAFIISCLPPDPAATVRDRELSANFVEALNEVPEALDNADLLEMPNLVVSEKSDGIVLTDAAQASEQQTFLFLPAKILRPTLTASQRTGEPPTCC